MKVVHTHQQMLYIIIYEGTPKFFSLFTPETRNQPTNPQFLNQKNTWIKMMHMTFYWGKRVTILFDSWKTDSWIGYIISLLACLLFSVFYQYMEDRRLKFKLLSLNDTKNSSSSGGDGGGGGGVTSPLLYSKTGGGKWSASRFAGAIMFGVNSAIGYFLMLAIMSFNGGVFIAVVLGLAVGYLVFRSGGDGGELLVADNPCACA
ncbi:copper transporter 5-like [Olea europaea var. sylvestris]|uniref:copper transporter 5-like n=1 Tax=Olea europaea var. sylvestris TaxID=158386 RepID=UPI000C1D3BF5|nr:copper transporter 5-like [Olea europaea var. sylvestris]